MSQEILNTPGSDVYKGDGRSPDVPRYAWVILFVVFLASVAAPLNQSKVPPMMSLLREAFNFDLAQAGSLMSVFAITGLILALPTGVILQKVGPKLIGIVALVCLVLGAAMGALAPVASVLLISRVIEGMGMGLISVIAPAIVSMWFPEKKRGTPMGIWATWVPVGSVLMYNLSPVLGTAYGWRSVWWLGAGFALVALVLFAWLMRMPDEAVVDELADPLPAEPVSMGKAVMNIDVWKLAFGFAMFNLVFMSIATFFPTFLEEVRGYSIPQAAFISSLGTMIVLVAAPLSGVLSDKLGTRRWMIVVPALILTAMLVLPFRVQGTALYAYMIAQGIISGAIPTATFSAVPEVMKRPEMAGFGMAILAVGQNLGMVIGPMLFGKLVENIGWISAGYWMIPVLLLGVAAYWLTDVR